jgi:Ca2+-binding RTX toxin-like protein
LIFGENGIDNLEGNEGDDTIFGSNGDDGLAGQEGDDSLVGGNGNDRLYGWIGNDVLLGDVGDDSLYGGSGNDLLTGGGGADTFNFGNDFLAGDTFGSLGLDTITDFQLGIDKIQLQGTAFTALQTISFATVTNDDLAAASSEIIVYSQATGTIFYNANGAEAGLGDGAAFAKLNGNPLLTAEDFTIS